jgi:hypothetical protein
LSSATLPVTVYDRQYGRPATSAYGVERAWAHEIDARGGVRSARPNGGYALLLRRRSVRRKRHALAGLQAIAHLARGCSECPAITLSTSLRPGPLSFHLARLFDAADPQHAIQSHVARVRRAAVRSSSELAAPHPCQVPCHQ